MTPETVIAGYKDVVGRLHARGIKVMGATITSSLHSTNAAAGSASVDQRRKVVNEFIRHGGLFDGVADFDAATIDPASGGLAARVPARQRPRRTRRWLASQPRRLSGDGQHC